MTWRLGYISLALLLPACSSMSSIENPSGADVDGVTYFMPKRDFLVIVTVDVDEKKVAKITKVALGTTAAYADTTTRYVMDYNGNLVGTNTLEVQVSDSGLLSATKSSSESKISDAFKSLAGIAGTMAGMKVLALDATEAAKLPASSLQDCATKNEHSFIFRNAIGGKACGLDITIEKLAGERSGDDKGRPGSGRSSGEARSGIFYRLDEPYLVKASGGAVNAASIVFSPSGSPTYFLPVAKSLFAKNDADLGITDGVLKKYKQGSEGELIALLKIPADVLSAYFSALGSTLDAFKTTDGKEAAALAESIKLELAKRKFDACLAAIQAKDEDAITKLKCSE